MEDYAILKFLGDGKFARVYKAFHKKENVIVALKIIKFRDQDDSQLILDEVRIHEKIQHDNIVKLYGYFPFLNNKFTIVMEYIEGKELFDIIEESSLGLPLDDQTITNYFLQLLNSIIYLHSINIIHRDIKPENILITKTNQLKLTDFGLAKKVDNISEDFCSTWCGTTEYLAPEIINDTYYNYKIDNWALGILLYELIIGVSPFESTKRKKTLRKIVKCNYSSSSIKNNLFKNIIQLLLVTDYEKRAELLSIKDLIDSNEPSIQPCELHESNSPTNDI